MTTDDHPVGSEKVMTSAAEPHQEVQEFLERVEETIAPPVYAQSVEAARERSNESFGSLPSEDVDAVVNFSIPGPGGPLAVRVYSPAGSGPHPVLVFYHGGGWVHCGLDTHDNVCAALTNRAECLTLSVDYRLAPEHPFPAALEDAYAAVRWVADHGETINADPGRIAVGGDSSGGNLAAATALLVRERGESSIRHQLLVIPVLNYAFDTDSYEENADGYGLTRTSMRWFWNQYLRSDVDGHNPFASPLRAADLSDLPPATILTAGFDPLRDEGIAYAKALDTDGVPVTLLHYDDMIHGFVNRPELYSRGDEALDDLAAELRDALADDPFVNETSDRRADRRVS